jgi:hypothetical protein
MLENEEANHSILKYQATPTKEIASTENHQNKTKLKKVK